ncbi:MAG: hypothetical protein IK026_01615 [Eubacteriaceae bacterium]|nr:hypothetical protein [Eubacteriaceae bacterium]
MMDTGTVSAELAGRLKGMYPDYLPVMMNDEGTGEIDFSNYTDQLDKQLVKYAKGGTVDLMSWEKAIEKYTRALYSQGFNNHVLNELDTAYTEKYHILANLISTPKLGINSFNMSLNLCFF